MTNKNKTICGAMLLGLVSFTYIVGLAVSDKNKEDVITKETRYKDISYPKKQEKNTSNKISPSVTSNDSSIVQQTSTSPSINNSYYSNMPITKTKDVTGYKPNTNQNSINSILTMKLYDLKTPSPIPNTDPPPIGWATGLATDMNQIMDISGTGAKLTGLPGVPFVNDLGGSTMLAELKFDNNDINKVKQNINNLQIKLSFEAMADIRPIIDTSITVGITDGWSFGLMQNLNGISVGGFGDYSDDIHTPVFLGLGYRDLGPTQTNWVKYEFLVPNNINFDIPLQALFLAEESTEPTTPQWTLMIRALKVEAIRIQ